MIILDIFYKITTIALLLFIAISLNISHNDDELLNQTILENHNQSSNQIIGTFRISEESRKRMREDIDRIEERLMFLNSQMATIAVQTKITQEECKK